MNPSLPPLTPPPGPSADPPATPTPYPTLPVAPVEPRAYAPPGGAPVPIPAPPLAANFPPVASTPPVACAHPVGAAPSVAPHPPVAPVAPQFQQIGATLPQPPAGLPQQAVGSQTVQPIVRWKKLLVLDRFGPPLPHDRCLKCCDPAERTVTRRVSCPTPGTIICFLILCVVLTVGLPLWLLLYFASQKSAKVEFALCEGCRRRRGTRLAISLGLLGAAIPLGVSSFLIDSTSLLIPALIVFAAGLIGLALNSGLVFARKIDQRWIHLGGGGKPFLESIPPATLPPC